MCFLPHDSLFVVFLQQKIIKVLLINELKKLTHVMLLELFKKFPLKSCLIYISASNPFRSRIFKSFNDGPLGCLLPISHFLIVEGLVFNTIASAL